MTNETYWMGFDRGKEAERERIIKVILDTEIDDKDVTNLISLIRGE